MNKYERNKPCPCGSKIKYKKCCLAALEMSQEEKEKVVKTLKSIIDSKKGLIPSEETMIATYYGFKITLDPSIKRGYINIGNTGRVFEYITNGQVAMVFIKENTASEPFGYLTCFLTLEQEGINSYKNKNPHLRENDPNDPYFRLFGNGSILSFNLNEEFVKPQYRRQGWATSLIKFMVLNYVSSPRNPDIHYITGKVRTDNIASQQMLEKMFFINNGKYMSIDENAEYFLYSLSIESILAEKERLFFYADVLNEGFQVNKQVV